MHKIHKVREMLCGELESYSNKEKIDIQSLDMIDKLSHAIKNIDKIIDREEGIMEYSNGNSMRGNSYGGNSYGGRYEDMSYGRGRDSMGRYSREGYSRDEEYNPNMYRRM